MENVKIRSRAPLRLGLAGGGTDVSPYSDEFGGAVLNVTIDRYAFVFLEPSADGLVHFIASDLQQEDDLPIDLATIMQSKLKLHAGVYCRMIGQFHNSLPIPLTIRTSVDAPAGSGLGSSSALVVALVDAFREFLDLPLGQYDVARLAYEIERIDLDLAGGKQDQYAAAFGGVNFIEFLNADRVIVNPLRISRNLLNELQSSIVTCFSGLSRRSEDIIGQQRQGMMQRSERTLESMHKLKVDANEMKLALLQADIPRMASILNHSWLAKRETASGVSTPVIDRLMQLASQSGALAGKVSGAGGGGFIMFIVPPERRIELVRALNAEGASASGAEFTYIGVESWTLPKTSG